MNRWFREAGKALFAFLAALTLIVQSVLPVCADTVDSGNETSASGYTVSESKGTYDLEYFDRIAINSVRGLLTIRPGDDFSISFPAGWEETPSFSVQDEILVVSGRKTDSAQKESEKSSDGSVVVLGEDEPAEGSSGQNRSATAPSEAPAEGTAAEAGTTAEAEAAAETETAEEAEAETETAAEAEPETETAAEAETEEDVVPEIVITIPSGVGLYTLRIAMEKGDLIMTDITANAVTIQSGGGKLVMKDVSLGTVDIYSEAGSVSMAECSFNSLNIGMAEGNVEVGSDDSLARCRMELKTGDGVITYNGASHADQYMQPGNGKRFLTIQIGSGNINING